MESLAILFQSTMLLNQDLALSSHCSRNRFGMLSCKTSQKPPKPKVARISIKHKELSQSMSLRQHLHVFLKKNQHISFRHNLCEQYLPRVEILVRKEADVVHFLLWLPGSILRCATWLKMKYRPSVFLAASHEKVPLLVTVPNSHRT